MRKKLKLLLLSFSCIIITVHAQRFQVTTGTPLMEEYWAVVQDPAINAYVAIGNVTNTAGVINLWISSYNAAGGVLTSAIANNNRRLIARDISIAPPDPASGQSTYYVTGWTQINVGAANVNQLFVGRIRLNGTFLWYQENPFAGNGNGHEGVAVVTEPATGDVVVLGNVQLPVTGGIPAGSRVTLSRFTPAGAIVWTSTYNTGGQWMARELDLGVAGGCAGVMPGHFVITGEVRLGTASGVPSQTFVANYNGNGVECWRNLYPAVAAGITNTGDAGYDVVWEPNSGNYCVVGVVQTGPGRAVVTSTPYILTINPVGGLVASSVYVGGGMQPLGLYPRTVSLGQNPGQVVFAGPNFNANQTFWGSVPNIVPPPGAAILTYAGFGTANSIAQPFILNDAEPEDVILTGLGTAPGYLVSTNARPVGAFGQGDGHFIKPDLAGQTPLACPPSSIGNTTLPSNNRTPVTTVRIPLQPWGNPAWTNNSYPVQQTICKDPVVAGAKQLEGKDKVPGEFSNGRITVFPNPVSDNLQVSFETLKAAPGEVVVTNVAGAVVYKGNRAFTPGKNQFSIPVQQLPGGTYLVRVRSDAAEGRSTFVVNNK